MALNGSADWPKFVSTVQSVSSKPLPSYVSDTDGDGKTSHIEFEIGMGKIISAVTAYRTFARLDANGDGKIANLILIDRRRFILLYFLRLLLALQASSTKRMDCPLVS